MDHARKIGKKKPTSIWDIKNEPPPLATDVYQKIGPKSPDYIEDKRLTNWKKWLEINKKTKKHLQSLTNRKNEDLVLNSYENYRKKIEKQCLIETASSPLDLEKSTKIGATRKKELIKNIKILQSKEPEINELIIKGTAIKNIKNRKTKFLRIPVITITTAEEFEDNILNTKNLDEDNALILKIFDKEIIFDELSSPKNNENPLIFNMTFVSNIFDEIEQTIQLENKGVYAIKYDLYKSCKKSKLISPLTKSINCFFIKKNCDIILPGQIVYIPVLFIAKSPGAFIEYWTFNTDPSISPIEFKFQGFCNAVKEIYVKNYDKNHPRSIDEYLNLQIRDKNIHDVIEMLMNNVIQYKEFNNKNPLLFYYPRVVKELEKIYNDVRVNKLPWNLSLNELRQLLYKINDPSKKYNMLIKFRKYHLLKN
ncbi:uncharacterized protein LOC122850678 [Aphidius gifuensis]|uniref:uncharacterized protein LOC122850678 n=1 Tax=Aphidius gifuensis TaxID=684658 RepID=UPI001CDD8105|nr:uncharacterized protein LOC122850678 [Aphidius gifuensis]